jgi:hypothetical protein
MCDVTPVRQAGGAGRRKRNSRSPTTRSTHDSHMLFGLDFTSELKALLQEVTGARRR